MNIVASIPGPIRVNDYVIRIQGNYDGYRIGTLAKVLESNPSAVCLEILNSGVRTEGHSPQAQRIIRRGNDVVEGYDHHFNTENIEMNELLCPDYTGDQDTIRLNTFVCSRTKDAFINRISSEVSESLGRRYDRLIGSSYMCAIGISKSTNSRDLLLRTNHGHCDSMDVVLSYSDEESPLLHSTELCTVRTDVFIERLKHIVETFGSNVLPR